MYFVSCGDEVHVVVVSCGDEVHVFRELRG